MSQKIVQFCLQAYFNLRRTLSSRINSIKRSSIFKVRQTPTRVPLIKTPGENSQSIFSSMDSDMQTVSTNILSSQGFFTIQTPLDRHVQVGPVRGNPHKRGNSSDGQKIIRQHSGTGSYHAKDLTTTSNYDVQKMVENWVTKTQEM